MNTPPLLLGAALLFWGWQAGLLAFAAPIAVLLEASRLAKARWNFSNDDFNRLWNLCTVLFIGAAVYAFAANDGAGAISGFFNANSFTARGNAMNRGARAVLIFIQWLPLIFLPMMAAQAWSQREKIDFATFSILLKRRKKNQPAAPSRGGLNVAFPYFAVCVVAASAANVRGPSFYAGMSTLLCWALWPRRSRRFPMPAWLALAAAVIVAGFYGAEGLRQLQMKIEGLHAEWLSGLMGRRGGDQQKAMTAIGQIGRLKLSGKIVLRVEPEGNVPVLLREASYNTFRNRSEWAAAKQNYGQVFADADALTWKLLPEKNCNRTVTLHATLASSGDLLPLPFGTGELQNLSVSEIKTNRFGKVLVTDAPGLASFRARYGAGRTVDGAPDENDVSVPKNESAALKKIAEELNLASLSDAQKLEAIEQFFLQHFEYTQFLESDPAAPKDESPLTTFLLRRRAGHCEYFGTATTLLLRQAGVPARYATGYSVQERDQSRGTGYVVRERHGHAWCLAYVDGAWRDFDTTPASWVAAEAERAPWWEAARDWFSRWWFEFQKWRAGESRLRTYLGWLVAALAVLLVARLVQKRQWSRAKTGAGKKAAVFTRLGEDSEFFEIERRLEKLGFTRGRGETHAAWLQRLERASVDTTPLRAVLALHCRYRFDPLGLDDAERAALKSLATQWLNRRKAA